MSARNNSGAEGSASLPEQGLSVGSVLPPSGTPGSSDDTGWLNSGSIATALKGRDQICGCKTLSDAPDGRPADAAAGSSATLEGLSGDAEGFCPP